MLSSPATGRPIARHPGGTEIAAAPGGFDLAAAARLPVSEVLARLGSGEHGLSAAEAARRLQTTGLNALAVRRVSALAVLMRQLRNPLLLLLLAAAAVSGLTGDPTDAAIIAAIVVLSVGLGFVNEYRAASAVAALHADIRHDGARLARRRASAGSTCATSCRATSSRSASATSFRPTCGCSTSTQLECDEAVLTGESMPATKAVARRRQATRARRPAVVRVHGHRRPPGRGARRRRLDGHGDGVRRRSRRDSPSGRPRPRSRSGCATSRACS